MKISLFAPVYPLAALLHTKVITCNGECDSILICFEGSQVGNQGAKWPSGWYLEGQFNSLHVLFALCSGLPVEFCSAQ